MRIAVLGGGLQGCCVALALAERGADAVLFDRNAALFSGAATVNEGKIHLGYVYAGDESLATARMMAKGALAFAPLVERYLGALPDLGLSSPFTYLVHRDSQKSPEEFAAYLEATHALILAAAKGREQSYFGRDLCRPIPLTAGELASVYDGETVRAGFRTPEIAVNPLHLAAAFRARLAADPRIELRLRREVSAVEDDLAGARVLATGPEGKESESFDHVVNALWDGRLAIDAARGLAPAHPWLYRFKYGIRFRPARAAAALPSLTIVLGPFGDVVGYGDGLHFLSWYPAGMIGTSRDLVPPAWPSVPEPAEAKRIAKASFEGMARILPSLAGLDPAALQDISVIGGTIFAWGRTDIDDRNSALHRRYEIGVSSAGAYHSIDPGKLTMAPYFASVCAERIFGQ